MTEHVIQNSGEYADLALSEADGRVYLCAETAARDAITVYRGADGQNVIASLSGEAVGGQIMALYPRIAVNPHGGIAVVYQRGPQVCAALIHQDDVEGDFIMVRPTSEEPFGVEPCAVAWIPVAEYWRVAYVARIFGLIRLVTRDYDRDGHEIGMAMAETDTTQGISRILRDGSVLTVDADNRWSQYPNLSRPVQVGRLVLGQANNAPARAIGYVGGPNE